MLVFRVGQLGDAIVSLPAIQAIRDRHPGDELILVTEKQPPERVSAWDVLGPTGLFSSVLTYDASRSFRTRATAALTLAAQVRRRRVRICYYLSSPQRSRRQVWRVRLFYQVICGIPDVRDLAVTGDVTHGPAGAPIRQPAETLRLMHIVDAGRKAWPDARLLVGDSRREADLLRRKHGERVVSAATTMKVWESAEALRRCVLYVGNSSSAMHLAAVMGTPCIAISSARDLPGMWEPQGAGHVTLYRQVPCAGCLLSTCTTMGLVCLTRITVDEVFAVCASVLASRTLSGTTP